MQTTTNTERQAGLSEIEAEYVAQRLLKEVPFVSSNQTCIEVFGLLTEHPELIGLPVVDNDKPLGLINRNRYMDEMAKPFRREVFAKKSCMAFMDVNPLVVDNQMSIEKLSFKAIESGGKTLKDGFIIVDGNGDYLGIGTGEDLMSVVSHLQAEKNRLVMESINYASVIQKSFLRASRQDMMAAMNDYAIEWDPRDKVGGDYYFCKKFDDGFFLALIDCTGHGVPGAFMTLIMASFLDHILMEENRHDPAGALASMNQKVKAALGQVEPEHREGSRFDVKKNRDQSDDGMDTAFLWVNQSDSVITYAGAKTPLFILSEGANEITVIEGDKKGVGYVETPMDYKWTNRDIAVTPGSCVYITTDGIIDQIGGPKKIAFGKRRFCDELLRNHSHPMGEQLASLLTVFKDYQGKQARRDDVTLFGFRA